MVEALIPDAQTEETPADEFLLNAADTLAGLHMVPDASAASVALRRVIGPQADAESLLATVSSLHRVRSALLVEANPDYWVEQVAGPCGPIDEAMVEMTSSLAQSRCLQARMVAEVLDRLGSVPEGSPVGAAAG